MDLSSQLLPAVINIFSSLAISLVSGLINSFITNVLSPLLASITTGATGS